VRTHVDLHPLGREHISAWNLLLAEIEEVDRTGEHYNEADLAEEMDNPDIELGKDLVGALLGEELVGYFCVYPRAASEGRHRIVLDGGVRPDVRGRGVGSLLAQAMRTRALQAHQERHPDLGAHLSLRGLSDNPAPEGLMADIGLAPERWSFVMRADLSDPAPESPQYRAAGYDEASLDVDSENPTGALGIYRRTGFEVESRWTDYAAEVEEAR
jgi:mycothiol synthase